MSPRRCARVLLIALAGGACGGGRAASTAPPGSPLAAPGERTADDAVATCRSLAEALDRLAGCQRDPRRRAELRAWRDRFVDDAAALAAVDDARDRIATAGACAAAGDAVAAAQAAAPGCAAAAD